jgi:hypothetical protein
MMAGPALRPIINTLRESVANFTERALGATHEIPQEARSGANDGTGPEYAAEIQLEVAAAASEIYERLVQLEALSGTSIHMDWQMVKQAATATARGALKRLDVFLPSLQDAGTAERIKTAAAEIEAKLIEKPVTTGS